MEKIIYNRYSCEFNPQDNHWYVNEFIVTHYNEFGEPIDGGYQLLPDIPYDSEEEARTAANTMNRDLEHLSIIEFILPNTDEIKFNPYDLE